MIVRIAYLSIIFIWSTTPLAIQWSSQNGLFFGVSARMSIGLLTLLLIFMLTGVRLTRSRQALFAYIAGGLGIYTSMLLVYWGAQYIPSGWISIVFGMSPIITGVLSYFILKENHFSFLKAIGIIISLSGLLVIFGSSINFGENATYGVLAVLTSTMTHSLSAVILKRINAPITGMESTYGGLMLAVPLFLLTYAISGESFTHEISMTTVLAILYLGVLATAIGFSIYYFILLRLDPVRVSLITLVTPVCALLIGKYLNSEPITFSIVLGTSLVLFGLVLFKSDQFQLISQFKGFLNRRREQFLRR